MKSNMVMVMPDKNDICPACGAKYYRHSEELCDDCKQYREYVEKNERLRKRKAYFGDLV